MELIFPQNEIQHWADRYKYPRSDTRIVNVIAPAVRTQGFYRRDQLLEVCQWKSPRSAPKAQPNSEALVEEVTRIAFATELEQVRIEVLTILSGVRWPVASTLLHFVHPDYPILDVRALWSLGEKIQAHQHSFELWNKYLNYCRNLSQQCGVSVRTLDKALWQYAKENQPVLGLNDDD